MRGIFLLGTVCILSLATNANPVPLGHVVPSHIPRGVTTPGGKIGSVPNFNGTDTVPPRVPNGDGSGNPGMAITHDDKRSEIFDGSGNPMKEAELKHKHTETTTSTAVPSPNPSSTDTCDGDGSGNPIHGPVHNDKRAKRHDGSGNPIKETEQHDDDDQPRTTSSTTVSPGPSATPVCHPDGSGNPPHHKRREANRLVDGSGNPPS